MLALRMAMPLPIPPEMAAIMKTRCCILRNAPHQMGILCTARKACLAMLIDVVARQIDTPRRK